MTRSFIRKADENFEDYLFHYTTASGLEGIVSNGYLWATHHGYMNDKSEIQYGFGELFRIAHNSVYDQLANPNSRIRKLAEHGFIFEHSAKAWAAAVQDLIVSALGCYLFCLCAHDRKASFQHGLLSQWRGYGDDGGYAIRFNKSRLNEYLSKLEKPLKAELQPVVYGLDPARRPISSELKSSISAKVVEFCEHTLDRKESLSITDFIDMRHISEILDYVVFTKNEHFAEENEWRICAIRNGELGGKAEKYKIRAGTIVPYVELRSEVNINSCIDQVIVGPHPEKEDRCVSTINFLRSHGCEAWVVPSDIPLRAD